MGVCLVSGGRRGALCAAQAALSRPLARFSREAFLTTGGEARERLERVRVRLQREPALGLQEAKREIHLNESCAETDRHSSGTAGHDGVVRAGACTVSTICALPIGDMDADSSNAKFGERNLCKS